MIETDGTEDLLTEVATMQNELENDLIQTNAVEFPEIFEIRESPGIGTVLLKQIVMENAHLDSNSTGKEYESEV